MNGVLEKGNKEEGSENKSQTYIQSFQSHEFYGFTK